MATKNRFPQITILIEKLLLYIILLCIAYNLYFFIQQGYLAPPFGYDTLDNFMDGYNTAYWSNNYGAYDIWGTVYPPLSFIFLKIFSLRSCYFDGPFAGRACDWLFLTVMVVFFGLNIYLSLKCYQKSDARTAVVRTISLCLGLPMLFAFDRGNLIIPCFTFFALFHGNINRSSKWKWLSAAIAVNFKPYLVVLLAPLIVRRRWRLFERAALAIVFVYLMSWALFGSGSIHEIVRNTFSFEDEGGNSPFSAMFYGNSYTSMLALLKTVPVMSFVGSRPLELIELIPVIMIHSGQIGVFLCFVGAAFLPSAVTSHRLTALVISMVISTVEVGGYAQIFLLFLVFQERWKGVSLGIALVSAYLLCIPIDHMAISLYHEIKPDFLSGRTIDYDYGVSWGMFLRPGLILIIEYALTFATILDLAREVRPRLASATNRVAMT